jgi:hypothetical protein
MNPPNRKFRRRITTRPLAIQPPPARHEWRGGQAVVFLGGRVLHQTSFANEPLDALSPPGIDHLDMPTMPDRIRQVITAASVGG